MALKIGDKVRFLNTVGGGIVKRFVNKELVAVEEDGFETPVLIKECVVIEPVSPKNNPQISSEKKHTAQSPAIKMPASQVIEMPSSQVMNVALAFLPIDEKNLQTSDYEAYLVNKSNYYLQFSYLSQQEKGWILRHAACIEPNQQLFLEEFSKQDLNNLERICIQFIAYKEGKSFDLKPAISVEHRIDTVKFYKLHSFQENDYFEDKAMILPIVKDGVPIQPFHIDSKELFRAMESKNDIKQHDNQRHKEKISQDILEIDLHASQLLDSTSGLNNSEILRVQLDKFHEIMNANLKLRGKKIVFIHGKGEGVLRKALIDEVKQRYKSCQFQDASFREYGFGATMIIIK